MQWNKLSERRIADWMKAAYGGVIAELVVTGRFSWKSYEDDKSLAGILASTVSSSEQEALALQKLMFIRNRTLLERRSNQTTLKKLAKELLAQETLSRRSIGSIVRTALKRGTPSDLRNVSVRPYRLPGVECGE